MSDETKTTLEHAAQEQKSKPAAKLPESKHPRNNDETRTLSSLYPTEGIELLDRVGDVVGLDRAATIRLLINLGLRQIVGAKGEIVLTSEADDLIPFANMVSRCLKGVSTK